MARVAGRGPTCAAVGASLTRAAHARDLLAAAGVAAAALLLAPATAHAQTRLFYCGTVEYRAEEHGTFGVDRSDPDGERLHATRTLERTEAATWSVCLECPRLLGDVPLPGGAPLLGCSAAGAARLRHAYLDRERSEHVAAGANCGERFVRPGPRTVRDVGGEDRGAPERLEATVQLMAVEGQYTVGVVSETDRTATRRSWLHERVTHPCAVVPPQDAETEQPVPVLVVHQSEPRPWDGAPVVEGREELAAGPEGRTFCREPAEEGETCGHRAATTFAWRLVRKESDCTADVTRADGEATLDGQPLPPSGTIPLSGGARLQTRGRARVELKVQGGNSLFRLGSDTDARLPRSPCSGRGSQEALSQLVTGRLFVLLGPIHALGARFEIGGQHTAPGVRGFLDLLRDLALPRALADEPPAAGAAGPGAPAAADPPLEAATLPEGWPDEGPAALLAAFPDGAVGVKALRGTARVEDPAAPGPVRLAAGKAWRGPAVARSRPVVVTIAR